MMEPAVIETGACTHAGFYGSHLIVYDVTGTIFPHENDTDIIVDDVFTNVGQPIILQVEQKTSMVECR